MTPAEFDSLCWRHEIAVQETYGPMAMLATIYVNAHLKEGSDPVEPSVFIPGMQKAKLQFPPGVIPISPAEMKRRFSAGPSGKRK